MDDRTLLQWLILFAVFDGDPFRWKAYLAMHGSEEQQREDWAFVKQLCEWNGSTGNHVEDVS